MNNPIVCKDCNAQNSRQRFPEQDRFTHRNNEMRVCFKCRVCGALTWYPIGQVKWAESASKTAQQ